MANSAYHPNINFPAKNLNIYKGSPPLLVSFPFHVVLHSSNALTQALNVKVSRYSALLTDFDIKSLKPILGLDYYFPIEYGRKIYLETYFDRNLSPVAPRIKCANKWSSFTLNPGNTSEAVPTYPGEIEFITKIDLDNKKRELDAEITSARSLFADHINQIIEKENLGLITTEEAEADRKYFSEIYTEAIKDLERLRGQLGSFFEGSTSLRRKQFKTFTLIGYTTKDESGLLYGRRIRKPLAIQTTNDGVTTVTQFPPFKIVQTLTNDLVLVDAFYNDVLPCKLPSPYHKPVYPHLIEGEEEDSTNTQ